MSTLPNWNPSQQRQDYQNTSYAVPMSADHGVTELTWENGQLGMHGVNKSATTTATTTTAYGGDTLESIVHQATYYQKYGLMNMEPENQKNHEQPNISNNTETPPPPMVKQAEQVQMLIPPYTGVVKKRARMESDSDQCGRYLSNGSRMLHDLGEERSGCASAGATFCRDNFNKDATFVTWGSSFDDSPPAQSFKIKTNDFDDSASNGGGLANNNDEEQETKGGSLGTCSARRSRAAAVHNQSERRRRDRINQKMKALQKLVPNANKTDKASMLDEVIDYLKQLQSQVDQMMSSRTIVPQTQMMVNTLAMQQQMQMSLLASRMGSMPGFGMFDLNAMAMARVPPHPSLHSGLPMNPAASLGSSGSPFMPSGIPTPTTTTTNSGTSTHGLNPFNHPYNAFLAQQTGNTDFYSKMAALYRHDQANQARSNPLPNFSQGK